MCNTLYLFFIVIKLNTEPNQSLLWIFLCLFMLFFWLNIFPQNGQGKVAAFEPCLSFLWAFRFFASVKLKLHSSHWNDWVPLVPSCFERIWAFRCFLCLNDASHMSHWETTLFSGLPCIDLDMLAPWVFRRWTLISFLCLNLASHTTYAWVFASEWTYLMWFNRLTLADNSLPQVEQVSLWVDQYDEVKVGKYFWSNCEII